MKTVPTTEDRVWAVLGHLSALALGMGIAIPIIAWSDQRRKSKYASFQALQALGYQSLGFTVWILLYLLLLVLASIVLLVLFEPGAVNDQNRRLQIALLIVIFLPWAAYLVLPVVAAAACALGRDFRYPLMGKRLARYLDYGQTLPAEAGTWLIEAHELRWVAAMGHFSILIMLWGMLAPLTALVLYGKHNSFLKFQSVQALVFQGITTLLILAALLMYLLGALLLFAGTGLMGDQLLNSTTGIFSLFIFGTCWLISFLMILFVPVLHILGQWAGYRILKGDGYRYPWLGRQIEKFLGEAK